MRNSVRVGIGIASQVLATGLVCFAVAPVLLGGSVIIGDLPWAYPVGTLRIRLDALGAFFLVARPGRTPNTEATQPVNSGPGTNVFRIYPNDVFVNPIPTDMPESLKQRKTLRFVFKQVTGDFDVKMRVPYIDLVRTPNKGGFNARLSLDAASPNVGTYVNPLLPGRNFVDFRPISVRPSPSTARTRTGPDPSLKPSSK